MNDKYRANYFKDESDIILFDTRKSIGICVKKCYN
jgi:hypothetical protein